MSLIKHSAKDCYGVICETTKVILTRLQHAVQLDVRASCVTLCVIASVTLCVITCVTLIASVTLCVIASVTLCVIANVTRCVITNVTRCVVTSVPHVLYNYYIINCHYPVTCCPPGSSGCC